MTDTDASLLARLQDKIESLEAEGQAHVDSWVPEGHPPGRVVGCLACDDLFGHADLYRTAAAALRGHGEALRRLQEEKAQHEALYWPNSGDAGDRAMHIYEIRNGNTLPYVEAHVEALVEVENARQSGAEVTEAGGRSQPLAPIEKELG